MILPTKEFWELFKKTVGAFSTPEAIALYNIVSTCKQGRFIELGSHKGKSSMVIAAAMHQKGTLVLVEPEFKDKEWAQDVIGKVQPLTNKIVQAFGSYSLDILPLYSELIFCFVDSGVHDDLVMEEVKLLEDKIVPHGIIAFHDYLNQFTAVERAYNYLLSTGKYEKIEINWGEIFDYVRDNNLEEGNNSWHEKGSMEFPCFIGALKRK